MVLRDYVFKLCVGDRFTFTRVVELRKVLMQSPGKKNRKPILMSAEKKGMVCIRKKEQKKNRKVTRRRIVESDTE